MNGILILALSLVALGAAYIFYGRWIANSWGIDPNAKTPAYELEDGVDYVPASKPVVFGHQFASIAGAGPINGPIIAAMFGWVPVLLWILVGGIFFGAVQDLAALYASIKNKGRTIGYIIELYIGKTGKKLFLLFVWLFSILVVAAFSDIVAGTFNGFNADGTFNVANASTAMTSVMFIAAAVIYGFFIHYKKCSTTMTIITAVLLMIGTVAFGLAFPIYASKTIWLYLVFVYVFLSCVTPIWALLQPRDFLNSILLIVMIIGAVAGIFVANPVINIPAFSGFNVNGQMMFPIMFVTIACGAVSGFHSLVASGTTSKQIQNEKDILPVSFGAMLTESCLAVISLIAVGALSVGGKLPAGTPPVIFAEAIAGFLSIMGIPQNASFTIITLAVSAFALTSLDSVARVGRLAFQEIFMDSQTDFNTMHPLLKLATNKYFATVVTLVLSYLLAIIGYQNIWPLFGSANQLLSALALFALAVFLKRTKRKGFMLWAPMFIMLAVTFTALFQIIYNICNKVFLTGNFVIVSDGLQIAFAVLLLALGFLVAVSCIKKLYAA
ncbi:MAG: Carbon starvation protein A [Firmicutes bacterium ADurb.Bin193]|nr:MAG: Carbon starvation protein A [Firmicutes bacterium ADurb.Bin193]